MKKTLLRIGIIPAQLVLMALLGFAVSQTTDAPKLTPEQKTKILELQKQSLQYYIQIQQIQKKYEDALRADPQYVELSKANDGITAKLKAEVDKILKGVDQKKWTLDYQTLEFKPPAPEKK